MVVVFPSLTTLRFYFLPHLFLLDLFDEFMTFLMALSSTALMISPEVSPAFSAPVPGLDLSTTRTPPFLLPEIADHFTGKVLYTESQPRPDHLTLFDEIIQDLFSHVNGNGNLFPCQAG